MKPFHGGMARPVGVSSLWTAMMQSSELNLPWRLCRGSFPRHHGNRLGMHLPPDRRHRAADDHGISERLMRGMIDVVRRLLKLPKTQSFVFRRHPSLPEE